MTPLDPTATVSGTSSDIAQPDLITEPPVRAVLTARDLFAGPPISASDRVRLYSPSEWEQFIKEWAFAGAGGTEKYDAVYRVGGSGDEGRDVIAYLTDDHSNGPWDNFQCKHYEGPLSPGDIWTELGKLTYYTWRESYTVPRKYVFVAPRDATAATLKLLGNPTELRNGLIAAWEKKCENKISRKTKILLVGALLDHVQTFDFSIVRLKPIHEVIEEHSRTRYHVPRFGGPVIGSRPADDVPPEEIEAIETQYVRQLLEAYQDHLKEPILDVVALEDNARRRFKDHLRRQREAFFRATSLERFERDIIPGGEPFRGLKNSVYRGVVDTCLSEYPDGFTRANTTLDRARALATDSYALRDNLGTEDKAGIVHMLVNEQQLHWVQDNDD